MDMDKVIENGISSYEFSNHQFQKIPQVSLKS